MGAVFTTIGQQVLTERLDAEFYKPVFLDNERKLKLNGSFCHFENLLDGLQLGYTGPTEQYYEETGVNYLSSKNLIEGFIEITDATDRISVSAHKSVLAKSAVKVGDVLISRTGTVGKGAVVSADLGEANIAAHLIALRLGNYTDSYFFGSFLNSSHGMLQSERHQRGTIIQGLSVYDIPNFIIPLVSSVVQKYIGDKVRQAELLRAWAKATENIINQYHLALIPEQSGLDFAKRVRKVSPSRMSERLDAHFYPGVVDEYLRIHQGQFKTLGQLCDCIYNGQTQPETSLANQCKQITVTNLSSSFLGGMPRDVEVPAKEDKFLQQFDVLMCNAAHNKTYIGKDLTYVHSDASILPSTEVMTIRVDRKQLPASYVRAYLMTKLGYVQIQSTIRGITAHSYPGDMALLDIYLPEVPDVERETWFGFDQQLALAGKACEVATQLTNAAKLLVEALIEGLLDENLLITAQDLLQTGNASVDRGILNRLRTDGFDGQGEPLFSDLDTLYDLLAQATADQERSA